MGVKVEDMSRSAFERMKAQVHDNVWRTAGMWMEDVKAGLRKLAEESRRGPWYYAEDVADSLFMQDEEFRGRYMVTIGTPIGCAHRIEVGGLGRPPRPLWNKALERNREVYARSATRGFERAQLR